MTIQRKTRGMKDSIWKRVRLLALAFGASMLTGCLAHNTGAGLATEIDKGALFSTTLQSFKWQNGTATLRHTQGGYDQVKMTGWGPVLTLARGLPDPRIERIDVVSGHPVLMVSTRGDASCPRRMQLLFRENNQTASVDLPNACQTQQVVMRDGAMWGGSNARRDEWKTDGVNAWVARPTTATAAPRSRPHTRTAAARSTPAKRSGPSPSLTAPMVRPSSGRLSHLEKVGVTDTAERERSPEVGRPVRVDITGG